VLNQQPLQFGEGEMEVSWRGLKRTNNWPQVLVFLGTQEEKKNKQKINFQENST